MEVAYDLSNIHHAARALIPLLDQRRVIALHGEMGAGKTTLVSAIITELGIADAVSSPTFSIINEYRTQQQIPIYHIDLYRLKNAVEALDTGLLDCLDSGSICFVEWPDIASSVLPPETLHVYISDLGNQQRKLRINL